MPRPRKPPRLYLRRRAGRPAQWVILDGADELGTGCGESDARGAEQALARHIAGKYEPPPGKGRELADVLIADVMTAYLREHAPHTRSVDFIRHTAAPIIDWWGDRALDAIKAQACRDYVDWRCRKGVSDQTARHDLKTLRAALRYYHAEHGPLPAVPAITLPARSAPRQRWLTRGETARLVHIARRTRDCGHIARFVLIGTATGTRSAALLQLRWLPTPSGGHVDLEAGVIHRRGAAERDSTKRRPPVRIPVTLLPHLQRWRAMDLARGIVHVVHHHGRPIRKLRRSWARVRELAGLGTDVVPHTLRHTAATWLMQRGVDMYEAAGFLGMTAETLETVYGHHHPDFQLNAAAARRRA